MRRRAGRGALTIKRVSMVRRREDLSHDEFVAYWLGPHAEIAKNMPGALAYVVNIARDPQAAGRDGFAWVWVECPGAAQGAVASEPFASRIRADRPKFVGEQTIFFVDETTLIRPASDR